MRRILCIWLLLVGVAHAETLDSMLNSVRMVMMDRGSPVAFDDTVYMHHARNALQFVGVRSLSVAADTTIPMGQDTLLYTLARPVIQVITAYSSTGGALTNLPRVPHKDMWKKETEEVKAYSIGPGNTVFVTRKMSYEDSLHLHYITAPAPLPADSSTDIDLPNGLLPALHYQTAADVLDATRVPTNVQVAAKHSAKANALIQIYLISQRATPADTAALPR